jgi:predicted nucleic acid-binding protein
VRYLLDTSAFMCLRDNEPGAARVAAIVEQGAVGEVGCCGCFMTLMELYYRVWKDEGRDRGREAYDDVRRLPVEWIHESPELLERAAALKATQSLSLADAWIGAAALEAGAILVHKDPEYQGIRDLQQELLPRKRERR